MYHNIEFKRGILANRKVQGMSRPMQILVKNGDRRFAKISPRVVTCAAGHVEVADLLLQDGSVAHGVRFASFRFVDENE